MAIEYNYDEEQAQKADKAADAISEAGPYVGVFKRASAITAQSGSAGIAFEFEVPGTGATYFSLYVQDASGNPMSPGGPFLGAIQFLLGCRGLKSEVGDVEVYDEEAKARVTQKGEVFPSLCGKPIGILFQKELYSKNNGMDGERLSPILFFQPETKLTMTEIKGRVAKPVKLERLVKSLKVYDKRKKGVDTPQPSVGGIGGDY